MKPGPALPIAVMAFALAAFLLLIDFSTTPSSKTPANSQANANSNWEHILKLYIVKYGEEFTLRKGDTAQIQNEQLTVTLTGFTYSPCPTGSQCIWSGLAVHVRVKIDGVSENYVVERDRQINGYNLKVVSSDWKTKATMVIDLSQNSGSSQNQNQSEADPRACVTDDDCGLHMCAGCYSRETLADPNLVWTQCAQYNKTYTCRCEQGQCQTVRNN